MRLPVRIGDRRGDDVGVALDGRRGNGPGRRLRDFRRDSPRRNSLRSLFGGRGPVDRAGLFRRGNGLLRCRLLCSFLRNLPGGFFRRFLRGLFGSLLRSRFRDLFLVFVTPRLLFATRFFATASLLARTGGALRAFFALRFLEAFFLDVATANSFKCQQTSWSGWMSGGVTASLPRAFRTPRKPAVFAQDCTICISRGRG